MNEKQRSEYFLEKLIAVPSISGDEAAGVQVCRDLMTEVGLATQLRACAGVEGSFNVEGSLGSARPKLCIAGHVDTLPFEGMTVNPLGERRGNRYYGRGTTDMGALRRIKYGVVGSIVNVAARIESFTVGGQTLIGDFTRQVLGHQLVVDGPMEAEGKGLDAVIRIWEVLALRGEKMLVLPSPVRDLAELPAPLDASVRVFHENKRTRQDREPDSTGP